MNKIITSINPSQIASSRRPSAQSPSLPKSSRDSEKDLRARAIKGEGVVLRRNNCKSGGPLPGGGGPPTIKGSKQPPAASTQTLISQKPREPQLVLFELGAPQW